MLPYDVVGWYEYAITFSLFKMEEIRSINQGNFCNEVFSHD
ncbi:hypothetical protein PU02_0511 [Bartonella ancashensis]|uniref:Uncharacterized protein n=1 Tax=Bartonella ancashensis TaxID=1318743 RepID=A0A0M3T2U1_9HYPH|nr:hypothetical protein PU02_0511 [Bartonella ancashensis]